MRIISLVMFVIWMVPLAVVFGSVLACLASSAARRWFRQQLLGEDLPVAPAIKAGPTLHGLGAALPLSTADPGKAASDSSLGVAQEPIKADELSAAA